MLKAQTNSEQAKEIIEQRIEELSAGTDMELDFSELYDHFLFLLEYPININYADEEELRELLFLNDNQIAEIIIERKRRGGFKSLYELKDLETFYIDIILTIKPFITLEIIEKTESIKFKNLLSYGKNQVLIRYGRVLEDQEGYAPIDDSTLAHSPNSRYLGSKDKLYFRYKYKYRDRISFGFLGDKDAGEEFFNGYNKQGFDFYSAHFYIKNQGKLKALALGDYHVEFGQGLTMWSGMAFGKSATSIDLKRKARGLRANTSANEVLFLRGAAFTLEIIPSIDFTAFYSNRGLDAGVNIRDTSDFEDLVFSSIQESGLHRTHSEMAKKHAVNEQLIGGNVNYRKNGFHWGVTSYKTIFGNELVKDVSPYQLYDFQGKENFNIGTDASYSNRYVNIYGEFAMSENKGKALLIGSLFNLHPRLTFSIYYRNFQKEYQNFYAIPMSEGGKAKNEEGIYFGSMINVGTRSNIRLYYDMFKFPWLKFRINAPSHGNEFSFQYERNHNRHLSYYMRYMYEEKMLNFNDDEVSITTITPKKRQGIRFHISYKVNHQLRLQSRLSLSTYEQLPTAKTHGYLIYQDIAYSLNSLPLKFHFRYAIFNTDDYDTRIYAYENNVLYKFSVPAYYYQGQKYYILLNYKLNKSLTFWLRFDQTFYANRTTIGSGLEEIQGNTRSEITAQLMWKF